MTEKPRYVSQVEQLASEWNSTKNAPLRSAEVGLGSSKRVWWTCPLGHDYLATVSNRGKGSGCSVCSGKTILIGFNDLATTNPTLAQEISPSNGDELLKFKISAGSNKDIWWRCSQQHEWQASPNNRRSGRRGCPVCSNRKVVAGVNDLATLRPNLAIEFSLDLNSPVLPNQVPSNSNKAFWWTCGKGHSWQNTLSNRVKGQRCPFCTGRRAITGETDLGSTHQELALEWHPTLNGDLQASHVKRGSGKKVWWLCEQGHSFQASVLDRSSGNGCGVCAGYTVLSGANDLATKRPELVSEIVSSDLQNLDPSLLLAGGRKRVLWQCRLGHQWNASIEKRMQGQGCPYCGNKKLLSGFNDLLTTNPSIAKEFDFEKNSPVGPSDFLFGTNGKYWWKCSFGHSWRTSSSHRVLGRGCPTCAVTGYNPSNAGLIYFIEHDIMGAKKIGITNVEAKTDRLKAFRGAGWKVLATFTSEDGQAISDVETLMLRWIRKELGLSQYLDGASMPNTGGASETFSGEVSSTLVLEKLKQLLNDRQVSYR